MLKSSCPILYLKRKKALPDIVGGTGAVGVVGALGVVAAAGAVGAAGTAGAGAVEVLPDIWPLKLHNQEMSSNFITSLTGRP